MSDSDAGWSEPPVPAEPWGGGQRYCRDDVLGEGGTAVVHAAYDAHLGREVALKRPRSAQRADRVAWEAWLVAQLDHPSIIPIYDAARDESGDVFFTMPLVRGASLAAALADADGPDLSALLRAFLKACEAMSYAHARGVVHRDLKPANIMVGEFGEVCVIDWGLAAPTPRSSIPREGDAHLGEVSMVHGAVGTLGFMSPEQADGEPTSPRADVFSLGRTLHHILESAAEERISELATVVARATAHAPSARFADAGELAEEIAAYLDGRRLATHHYTPRELAARMLVEFRVPIALAALGLLLVLVVTVVGFERVRAQKERARDAEARANAAARAAQLALGSALEERAVTALQAGSYSEAYLFAAHSLARRDGPTARGVIAAVLARPPVRARRLDRGGCTGSVRFSDQGRLCLLPSSIEFTPQRGSARAWSATATARDARPLADDRWLVLEPSRARVFGRDGSVESEHRGAYPPHRLLGSPERWGIAFSPTQIEAPPEPPRTLCGPLSTQVAALGPTRVVAICGDGRLVLQTDRGAAIVTHQVPFGARWLPAFSATFDPSEEHLLVGGVGGEVARVELASGQTQHLTSVAGAPVTALHFADAGLVIEPERGPIVVVDPDTGATRLRIPRPSGARVQVVGGRVAVLGPSSALEWRLEERGPPAELRASAGLSSALIAPTWIAAAGGDGVLSVWSRADGSRLARVELSPVVKRLARIEGEVFAALANDDGLATVDSASWTLRSVARDAVPRRRVAALGAGPDAVLLTAAYRPGLRIGAPPAEAVLGARAVGDLAVSASGRRALMLDEERALSRIDWTPGAESRLELVPLPRLEGAPLEAVAIRDDGSWAAAGRGFVRLPGEGSPRVEVPAGPLDLAFSPDGAHLLVGTREGTAILFDAETGERAAVFLGAQRRVAWVGFDETGDPWTASWDGALRRYSMRALAAAPDELVRDAEERTSLTLDDMWTPPR